METTIQEIINNDHKLKTIRVYDVDTESNISVKVDALIAPLISKFNNNKFYTLYSCSGHSDEYYPYAGWYIVFDILPNDKVEVLKKIAASIENLIYEENVEIFANKNYVQLTNPTEEAVIKAMDCLKTMEPDVELTQTLKVIFRYKYDICHSPEIAYRMINNLMNDILNAIDNIENKIMIKTDTTGFTPDKVRAVFPKRYWVDNLTDDELMMAMENSSHIVSAWDGDTLVGIARSMDDNIWSANIDCISVHKSYRKHGIADLLLKTLLNNLSHIKNITAAPNESKFIKLYTKNGFNKITDGSLLQIYN